jgi:hypothetical protein
VGAGLRVTDSATNEPEWQGAPMWQFELGPYDRQWPKAASGTNVPVPRSPDVFPRESECKMFNPWINLGLESAQLAVRLTRAWGLGIYDQNASKSDAWKVVSTEAKPEIAPKVMRVAKKKASPKKARPVIKRATASHPKSKFVRQSRRKSR